MTPWPVLALGATYAGMELPSALETSLERYSPTQRAPGSWVSTKIFIPGAKWKAPRFSLICAGLGIIAGIEVGGAQKADPLASN